MPKTGSQTVEASLQRCSLPHQIIRSHFVSPRSIAELYRTVLTAPSSKTWKQQLRQQLKLSIRVSAAVRLRNILRRCKIGIPKMEIITAVREPISLALSSVFQNYLYFVPQLDLLTLPFCAELVQRPKIHAMLENWFDQELKPILNLDIFKRPFPREIGYAIYENAWARVLVYRFEALGQLPQMIQEFLGCELPGIVNRNLASGKAYAHQYHYAKAYLRLPSEFLRARYAERIPQHFYTPEENAGFIRHWANG